MVRFAFLLATLVACGGSDDGSGAPGGSGGHANAPVDAGTSVDVPIGPIGPRTRLPFMTAGTTPLGSLDDVRFMDVGFIAGNCPATYELHLVDMSLEEMALFVVSIPKNATPPLTGTIMATAIAGTERTELASFEIVHLDVPPASPEQTTVRIAGRLTLDMGLWNVDFTVDATTLATVCLLL